MPRKARLDFSVLDDHGKDRVGASRLCRTCGEPKPAVQFCPRVVCRAKRGTPYVVFKPDCRSCRATKARETYRAVNPGGSGYRPTQEQRDKVLRLAGLGHSQRNIARLVACDRTTLARYFSEELRQGREQFSQLRQAA